MLTETLKMVLAMSVASVEDLREARKQVWHKFEDERSKSKNEFLVIMDGTTFSIQSDADFDEFNRQFTAYWIVRNALRKVIALTLFA